MAIQLEISGPNAHRVYQRDDQDQADIAFSVKVPQGVEGLVEGRISAGPWRSLGSASQPEFSAALERVPAGEHEIYVRIVSPETGELLVEGDIGPVYVGDLWVLAGQSNMEGCGRLIHVEEPQPGVSCFYMGDRWDLAVEPLCWLLESPDPVHWTPLPEGMGVSEEKRKEYIRMARRDRVHGSGLGLPFGKMMLRHTGVPVGLLMVAHGGTSMSQWDAALAGEGGRSLYGAMLRVIREAGGKVRGCLWYQGESDATEADSELYYDRMTEWVASLRRDLGDPELPFIYAQISVVTNWSFEQGWNRVQDDQVRLESVLGRAAVVPTIDASLADFIHPDAASLRDIGHRMAWAALRLVDGRSPAEPGPRFAWADWNEQRTELTITFSGVNGRLQKVERVFSFQLTNGEERLPLEGHLDEAAERVILTLERPAPDSCQLWHGRGTNPAVNVRDEKGIPLLVFGPLPV